MKRFSLRHDSNAGQSSAALQNALAETRLFSSECALEDRLATRLGIVVEELVANIITHGAPNGMADIECVLKQDGDDVRLTLTDNGIAFDPRAYPLPDRPHPLTGGGSGLQLVRAWAEIIDYRREDDRNRLDLVIRS